MSNEEIAKIAKIAMVVCSKQLFAWYSSSRTIGISLFVRIERKGEILESTRVPLVD